MTSKDILEILGWGTLAVLCLLAFLHYPLWFTLGVVVGGAVTYFRRKPEIDKAIEEAKED